jgi:DNA-binding MarR family transcriptional regulator
MSSDMLSLDKQICFRLYKASRTMTRLYQPILESLDITYPQYLTMLVLWEEDVIDFKELGRRLSLKTGTLTPVLKRLESLGYLHREIHEEDKRKVWVKITEEGRVLKSHARRIPQALMNYVDMDLTQYERYVEVLDELGELLDMAEEKLKREV